MANVYNQTKRAENFLLWTGRRFLMDFGFSNFLDKFEQRFGKWATTGLLAAVGLGVVSVVANLISVNVIIPIYEIGAEYLSPRGNLRVKYVVDAVWNIAVLLWASYYFVTMLQRRREMKEAEEYRDWYKKYSEEYTQYTQAVREFYEFMESATSEIYDATDRLAGRINKAKKDEVVSSLYGIAHHMQQAKYTAGEKVEKINKLLNEENSID